MFSTTKTTVAASFAVLLAACGGGGSGSSTNGGNGGTQNTSIGGNTTPAPDPQVNPGLAEIAAAPDSIQWTVTPLAIPNNNDYTVTHMADNGQVYGFHILPESESTPFHSDIRIFSANESSVNYVTTRQYPIELILGVNKSGQILARGLNSYGEDVGAHFLFKDGVYTPLPQAITEINDAGQLAGTESENVYPNYSGYKKLTGFIYTNGEKTYIPLLPGAASNAAYAMNDKGEITGWTQDDYETVSPPPTNRAFLYANGKVTDLGKLPGTLACTPRDLNNSSTVVGHCYVDEYNTIKSFIYRNGTLQSVPDVAFGHGNIAVNDLGQVTGAYWPSGEPNVGTGSRYISVYISSGGKTVDVNDLPGVAGGGWNINWVYDINNSGAILVETYKDNQRAYAIVKPAQPIRP